MRGIPDKYDVVIFLKEMLIIRLIIYISVSALVISNAQAGNNILEHPSRELAIIITESNYLPERLVAFSGEKIKLYFNSATKNKKQNCFLLEDKNFFLSLKPGQVSQSVFYFEKPGEYDFNCPATNIHGKFVILDKNANKKKRNFEESGLVKVWRPRSKEVK